MNCFVFNRFFIVADYASIRDYLSKPSHHHAKASYNCYIVFVIYMPYNGVFPEHQARILPSVTIHRYNYSFEGRFVCTKKQQSTSEPTGQPNDLLYVFCYIDGNVNGCNNFNLSMKNVCWLLLPPPLSAVFTIWLLFSDFSAFPKLVDVYIYPNRLNFSFLFSFVSFWNFGRRSFFLPLLFYAIIFICLCIFAHGSSDKTHLRRYMYVYCV